MSPGEFFGWTGFAVAFVAILVGYLGTIVLYVTGGRYLRGWAEAPLGDESQYLWVFLVPALNEAVTIADSVSRLRAVRASNKIVMVVNDGSTDETGQVLASLAGPDLEVLTRVIPHARTGKSAALNHAYRHVTQSVLTSDRYRHWDRSRVIFCIVDADGRLAADAPTFVARHFDDERVGGVQASVHIYNASTWLTRMQSLEFRIFGGLYQVGRAYQGTAFMGGNGQFNRLSALDSVAGPLGPWSDYLTEDQELGLRLLASGWRGEHETQTRVSQQGLNNLGRLYRQRTRWMQGNLQVLGDVGRLRTANLAGTRRLDALFTLVMPLLMVVVGTALVVALVLWLGFGFSYLPWGHPLWVAFFVQLAFGPVVLGVLVQARGRGWKGLLAAIAVAPSYVAYTWILWPVVFNGLWRQITGRRNWVKTEREELDPDAMPVLPGPAPT